MNFARHSMLNKLKDVSIFTLINSEATRPLSKLIITNLVFITLNKNPEMDHHTFVTSKNYKQKNYLLVT